METSAVLADAEDRVVDEAVAELERRHTSDQASTPEMSRRTCGTCSSSLSSACTTTPSYRSLPRRTKSLRTALLQALTFARCKESSTCWRRCSGAMWPHLER